MRVRAIMGVLLSVLVLAGPCGASVCEATCAVQRSAHSCHTSGVGLAGPATHAAMHECEQPGPQLHRVATAVPFTHRDAASCAHGACADQTRNAEVVRQPGNSAVVALVLLERRDFEEPARPMLHAEQGALASPPPAPLRMTLRI